MADTTKEKESLSIWLLTPKKKVPSYDFYQRVVVVCLTEQQARNTHPDPEYKWYGNGWYSLTKEENGIPNKDSIRSTAWCSPDDVAVEKIGVVDGTYRHEKVLCAYINYI